MLKVRFFLNEPNGKTWMHFKEMIPGLGEKCGIEIEVISKPREEYASEAYSKVGLPVAPAIMVGEEVLVQKADIPMDALETAIRRKPGTKGRMS